MLHQDVPGDRTEASMIGVCLTTTPEHAIKSHFNQLSESEVQKQTSTIGTRPRTHLCNLEICHLTDDLNLCFILQSGELREQITL